MRPFWGPGFRFFLGLNCTIAITFLKKKCFEPSREVPLGGLFFSFFVFFFVFFFFFEFFVFFVVVVHFFDFFVLAEKKTKETQAQKKTGKIKRKETQAGITVGRDTDQPKFWS